MRGTQALTQGSDHMLTEWGNMPTRHTLTENIQVKTYMLGVNRHEKTFLPSCCMCAPRLHHYAQPSAENAGLYHQIQIRFFTNSNTNSNSPVITTAAWLVRHGWDISDFRISVTMGYDKNWCFLVHLVPGRLSGPRGLGYTTMPSANFLIFIKSFYNINWKHVPNYALTLTVYFVYRYRALLIHSFVLNLIELCGGIRDVLILIGIS